LNFLSLPNFLSISSLQIFLEKEFTMMISMKPTSNS